MSINDARPRSKARPKDLIEPLADLIAANPGQCAEHLTQVLFDDGFDVQVRTVRATLFAYKDHFTVVDPEGAEGWYLAGAGPSTRVTPARSSGGRLYRWQAEALDDWASRGHRGVIEAVTGTGKTAVGIRAIADTVGADGQAVVLVPTQDLMYQWQRAIRASFPGLRVGLRGDGQQDRLTGNDVIVSVVNSARPQPFPPTGSTSLLIGDECHRYGSAENARALDPRFSRRLGLTATYERSDEGIDTHLEPYFGAAFFRYGYRQALDESVVADFKLALVRVEFANGERAEYLEADEAARDARRSLITQYGVPAEPFGEFMAAVAELSKQDSLDGEVFLARKYLSAFARRREILASAANKLRFLANLVPAVKAADRTLVFTETKASAHTAALRLSEEGIAAADLSSDAKRESRHSLLRKFEQGEITALCAPKLLDEGIDIPAADLGIIVATTKSRRQMIQRMGRVLRRKPDGRLARFAILYVGETVEDPATGAHEAFLDEIRPVAAEELHTADLTGAEACAYLTDFVSTRPPTEPLMAPEHWGS